MITFEPYGPFKVPIESGGIDKSREREFWDTVEDTNPGLSTAVGCYLFAIRAGRGVRPWYVGKTEKAGFKKEVFQDHKFRLYWEILKGRRKGTALLYFLAKHTHGGRFAKPSANGHSSIGILEELLIGTSLLRNSKLVNKRTTKHFRELQVPGYMNETPGARSQKARELAKLLGVAHNVK
jgi:hypothetical protein